MTQATCTILADSISPEGFRIISYEATYWRSIHAEQMTHRQQAHNSASTRAKPLKEQLRTALNDPFVPDEFRTAKGGMQPGGFLTGAKYDEALAIWETSRARSLTSMIEEMLGRQITGDLLGYDPLTSFASLDTISEKLDEIVALVPKADADGVVPDLTDSPILNMSKEQAGRLIEPYMQHTMVVTTTEPDHYMALRNHEAAQGEIADSARAIAAAIERSTPRALGYGEWHTPLVADGEFDDLETRIRVSAARCAAVSYGRQRADVPLAKLLTRYDDLVEYGHMSPLEHQARPFSASEWRVRHWAQQGAANGAFHNGIAEDDLHLKQIVRSLEFNGPFRGWHSRRKDIPFEDDWSKKQ